MKVAGDVLVLLACLSVAASAPRSELHHESHGETTEVDFLEDALGEWLAKFDTYTFMVKEDVDSSNDANNTEDDEDIFPEEARESDRERTLTDDEQSSFAPISVSLDEKGLLNPDVDYQVLVESLVAEEGSVFVTLSKYENKSTCGVGGFSKESKQNFTKNHLEIEHQVETSDATIIAFAIESESSSSFPGVSSSWDQISDDFWWVQGRLVGGGVLALTFTPPECGCLTISTYYALPVGKLTLVVGPQAYPTELQTLVCVDPARYQDCNEDKEEDEEHDTEESENSIGDNDEADEQDTSLSSWVRENGNEDEDSVSGKPRLGKRHKNRKARKEARRLERIKRMQANRQRIRQAGRQKVRQQLRQEKRKNDRKENRKRNRLNRQNGRLSKNKWKKLQKQRQNKNHQNHLNSTSVESGNNTNGEHNSTQPQVEEERLIDLLLGGTSNYSEVEGNSGNGKEDHEVDSSIVPGSEVEAETARARRKNRRQQRKDRRREKKIHHPGIKFCCKQGVKHKKYQLIINSTVEQGAVTPTTCNSTSDIVTTFANHQFAIDEESCKSNFVTCCSKFTEDMWDAIKNKKQARKTQRKERRKVRRQQRKQQRKAQRKEIRKLRKEQRRQNHWHDEDERELKDDDETTTMSSVQA